MHKRLLTPFITFVLFFSAVPAHPYTLMYTDASAAIQIKWATTTIPIAISASMSSAPNIMGGDVEGAVRRALRRWSDAGGFQFTVTTSAVQNTAQDNVNLISVTNTGVTFSDQNNPGRARVFFDPNTGRIQEADIALNPASQFSTDGTANTFDLEATLTHEIGHMLGLEHSAVIGATMQPQQGANNFISQYSLTSRTLSEDDRSGIRAIYAPRSSAGTLTNTGTLTGTVTNGGGGQFGAHVWAENVETGKVFAGNISITSGTYRIENITAGQYRVIVEPLDGPVLGTQIPTGSTRSAYAGLLQNTPTFRTTEAGSVGIAANTISTFNVSVGGTQSLNPRFIGAPNGSSISYSTVPVPLAPGAAKTIYIFGDTVNQVPESGVSLTSPFMSVVAGSYLGGVAGGMPYVKFDVATTFSAPPGEYSIRLQSNAGEVAYVTGGLTVDLANNAPVVNPLDTVDFFVRQQYRDFLNREPDDAGFQFWKTTLEGYLRDCGAADNAQAATCRARARSSVSEAFFVSVEFQQTGYLVYRLYRTAFLESSRPPRGMPRYAEFIRDTQIIGAGVIVNQGNWQQQLESNTAAFLNNFVQRAEFTLLYPTAMTSEGYVNALLTNARLPTTGPERDAALNAYGSGGADGRARALRSIAESDLVFRKEFNQAFVLMQYFGYLRRNPNDAPDNDFAGYDFWLTKLNNESGDTTRLTTIDQLLAPTKRAQMVEAFVVTGEYRRRFGTE